MGAWTAYVPSAHSDHAIIDLVLVISWGACSATALEVGPWLPRVGAVSSSLNEAITEINHDSVTSQREVMVL